MPIDEVMGLMLGVPGVQGGAKAKVYGARWDKSATPTLTRTDDAVGLVSAVGVSGGGPVVNDFDAAEIYKDISTVTDSLGNVFVRIPRFYIRETDGVDFKTWQISRKPFTGAYLPWCFWDFEHGEELPYIDIGKYPASLDPGNKLASKPGVYPLINVNIVNARTYARNNGPGYQQLDIHAQRLLQVLFYIEFATLDAQAIMAGFSDGQWSDAHRAVVAESNTNRVILPNAQANAYLIGQHIGIGTSTGNNSVFYGREILDIQVYDANNKALIFSGAPVSVAIDNRVYNVSWLNDFSGWIDASSGSLVSNSTGKWPMMYRGIENWYGGLWWWVDGVNILDWRAWVCYNADDYTSNLFADPYLPLAYTNSNANGYATDMGFDPINPAAQFPVAVSGSHIGYRDYYYQASGVRAAIVGGRLSDSVTAGPSYWFLYYSASHADVSIGARLVRKATG